jgi:hypothetical protein
VAALLLLGISRLVDRDTSSAMSPGSVVATTMAAPVTEAIGTLAPSTTMPADPSAGTVDTGDVAVTEPVDGDVAPSSTDASDTTAVSNTTAAHVAAGQISDSDCPSSTHGAVVDRVHQRGALCANGAVTYRFPLTSAWSQPDPGTYKVYAKDLHASSSLGGRLSTMTHFVAFTHGKYQGARIAFHSVPTFSDGSYAQPLSSVGTAKMHGASHGCLRVLPDDSVRIWDWLSIGQQVHVIS